MVEHPPIGRVRPAVNVQDQRILLRRIEIRRLLDPRLNLLSVEAGVPKFLGLGQIKFGEKRLVDICDLPFGAVFAQHEKLIDHRRRRDIDHGCIAVFGYFVILNRLVSVSQFSDFAGFGINRYKNGTALFRDRIDQMRAIFRPNNARLSRSARGAIVASDAARDVIIIFGGQVHRFRFLRDVQHPHIRLAVGAHGLLDRSRERQPLSVGRQRHFSDSAEQPTKVNRREQLRCSARHRDRQDFGLRQIVVRLGVAVGVIQNRLSIGGERRLPLVKIAARQLLWSALRVRGCRHVHDPDVLVTGRVRVACAVEAIDRTRDDLHVALVFWFATCVFLLLREVIRIGVTQESDLPAVGRPKRTGRRTRQIGNRPGLASCKRQQCQLRWRRFASAAFGAARICRSTHEGDPLTVRRPAWLGITFSVGQAHRRFRSRCGNSPQRCVIAVLLFVYSDANEYHVRTVGRHLRIADPLKPEQVFVGDRPLVLGERKDTGESKNRQNYDTSHLRTPRSESEVSYKWHSVALSRRDGARCHEDLLVSIMIHY